MVLAGFSSNRTLCSSWTSKTPSGFTVLYVAHTHTHTHTHVYLNTYMNTHTHTRAPCRAFYARPPRPRGLSTTFIAINIGVMRRRRQRAKSGTNRVFFQPNLLYITVDSENLFYIIAAVCVYYTRRWRWQCVTVILQNILRTLYCNNIYIYIYINRTHSICYSIGVYCYIFYFLYVLAINEIKNIDRYIYNKSLYLRN